MTAAKATGKWERDTMTGTGTAAATAPPTVEERWGQFFRWGPYGLLGLATLIGAGAADLLMTRPEMYAAGALILAALALQLWWGRAGRDLPEQAVPGRVYYVLRALLGFALSWLNPFFSIYAVLGYFDVSALLPRRAARAGLLATAVTMAGSQSGGLPPPSTMSWLAFGGLFVLNASLCLVFAHLGTQEDEKNEGRAATIVELERTNARLEQALAENAGLHAQAAAPATSR
ncbi:hypothetical protein [Streptomyces sp. A5-4]|uniref:hypothetical protein n=1 Tax=Streptomyces sp. A5-4 TaxID=3384771 RepID=UPI003DA8679C